MGDRTNIEWTDATWNPVRGCSRVSEGCTRCYAERVAGRFSGPGLPYEGLAVMTDAGPRWTGKVALVPEHLEDPLRWKKPRRIFVNSMSDLFHESLSDEDIERVFGVMALATQHTFQVLTKRAERMASWFNDTRGSLETREIHVLRAAEHLGHKRWGAPDAPFVFDSRGNEPHLYMNASAERVRNRRRWPGWPLPNVWLGVSVEDQVRAEELVPELLATPAAVRFLSCEPVLGPLDLWAFFTSDLRDKSLAALKSGRMPGVDWVIAGGESGPDARPMHPGWARSLRDQCAAAGVPYFFKQHGEWAPRGIVGGGRQRGDEAGRELYIEPTGTIHATDEDGMGEPWTPEASKKFDGWALIRRVGKKAAGRLLDGVTHDAFPEVAHG